MNRHGTLVLSDAKSEKIPRRPAHGGEGSPAALLCFRLGLRY
jgi:hypothetical protein